MKLHAASQREISSDQGTKEDWGKPRLSLLPWQALVSVAHVMTWACTTRKPAPYPVHNWRNGMVWSRVEDALYRHMAAHNAGEDTDPDSGLPHLAHAGFCVLVLLTYKLLGEKYGKFDDRYKGTALGTRR